MTSSKKDVRVRVAGIIIDNGKLLLIAHKKNGNIYWLLPGGGVEFGESLDQALKREFLEELNISVTVHSVALVCDSIAPSGDRHIINICFYCSHSGGEFALGNDKRLYDFAFRDKDELASVTIFPPINDDLAALINNKNDEKSEIYKGRIWLDK
ncbi:MAG: NUDIX hydrolase [bacterium]|nr:NUDIX hydrolase [bacterium]